MLLIVDVDSNSGPANVHKELVKNWPDEDEIKVISVKNPLLQQLIVAESARWADVSLIAGRGWADYASHEILVNLKVPTVVFNHGYMPFENDINGHGFSNIKVKAAIRDLVNADLVIANSELQAEFLKKQLPDLKNRVRYVRLGINEFDQAPKCECKTNVKKVVAVSGGDRPIKGNDIVIKAVGLLRDDGFDVQLKVYGEVVKPDIENKEWIDYRAQLDRKAFLEELSTVDCFVMNSRHEPFGLSALDALEAGTSLLLSRNCGVKEVLKTTEYDIIDDCENITEVKDKLLGIFKHPNSDRLFSGINFSACSWGTFSTLLRSYCYQMINCEI